MQIARVWESFFASLFFVSFFLAVTDESNKASKECDVISEE